MSPSERSALVKRMASVAGFDAAGVASVEDLGAGPEGARFRAWLEDGRHGTMAYLAREPGRRLDPGRVLAGARSLVVVALNHGDPEDGDVEEEPARPPGDGRARGRVARYARGRDYHKVFTARLKRLEGLLAERLPGVKTRRYADTGPVLEKLWAERAGLGWRGKHTNLVSREWGSWLLLGAVLLDIDLASDPPGVDRCGTCVRCLAACPTGAIIAPYRLDARLCISYLTIELRGPIPVELRPALGDRVFGCDDCLDVCPWNRFARAARDADFRPRPELTAPLLTELVRLDDAGFLRRFAGTAAMRARREGLARNACVALGNAGGTGAREALREAQQDRSAVVREHATWAIERLDGG